MGGQDIDEGKGLTTKTDIAIGFLVLLFFGVLLGMVVFSDVAKSDIISASSNNFTVTWHTSGDVDIGSPNYTHTVRTSSNRWVVSIQNLDSVNRNFNLSFIISNTSFDVSKISGMTVYEWKNISHDVIEYQWTNTTKECWYISNITAENTTYDCSTSKKDAVGTVPVFYPDLKQTKMALINNPGKVSSSYGSINIPKFGSKDTGDTYNGTKWFVIDFYYPFDPKASGYLTLRDENTGTEYDPWFITDWDFKRQILINATPTAGSILPFFVHLINQNNTANGFDSLDAQCGGKEIVWSSNNITSGNTTSAYLYYESCANYTVVNGTEEVEIPFDSETRPDLSKNPTLVYNGTYLLNLHMSNTNGNALDSTSRINHMAVTGTPLNDSTGMFNKSLAFDDDIYINNNNASLRQMQYFTMGFWVKRYDGGTGYFIMNSKAGCPGDANSPMLVDWTAAQGGSIRMTTAAGPGFPSVSTSLGGAGGWTHMVYVENSTRLTAFMNGTENASALADSAGLAFVSGNFFRIGGWTTSGCGAIGNTSIDEFFLYNNSMSLAEVSAMYNQGLSQLQSQQSVPSSPVIGQETEPTDPSTYLWNRNYVFEANVRDVDSDVDKVLFEHNYTGSLVNISAINQSFVNSTTSTYRATLNNTGAEIISWKWFANDTGGRNAPPVSGAFTIAEASSALNTTINIFSSPANATVTFNPGGWSTIAWFNATGIYDGRMHLFANDTNFTSSNNTAYAWGVGNIIFRSGFQPGTSTLANYTNVNFSSLVLTVSKAALESNATVLLNRARANLTLTFGTQFNSSIILNTTGASDARMHLFRDATNFTGSNDTNVIFGSGTWTFRGGGQPAGTFNNFTNGNYSNAQVVINTNGTARLFNYLNGTAANRTYNNNTLANISAELNITELTYRLYVESNITNANSLWTNRTALDNNITFNYTINVANNTIINITSSYNTTGDNANYTTTSNTTYIFVDMTPPRSYGFSPDNATSATYNGSAAIHRFNIIIMDNVTADGRNQSTISVVQAELDGSNYTVTRNTTTDAFSISFVGLSQATHTVRWFANDSALGTANDAVIAIQTYALGASQTGGSGGGGGGGESPAQPSVSNESLQLSPQVISVQTKAGKTVVFEGVFGGDGFFVKNIKEKDITVRINYGGNYTAWVTAAKIKKFGALLSDSSQVLLKPGEAAEFKVTAIVPENTPSGTYEILLFFKADSGETVTGIGRIEIGGIGSFFDGILGAVRWFATLLSWSPSIAMAQGSVVAGAVGNAVTIPFLGGAIFLSGTWILFLAFRNYLLTGTSKTGGVNLNTMIALFGAMSISMFVVMFLMRVWV